MDTLEDVLREIDADLKALRESEGRTGSKYAGPQAEHEYARELAERQTKSLASDAWRSSSRGGGSSVGHQFLLDVKAAGRGDPTAFRRLAAKAWTEGDGPSGGYLVSPEVLPGIVEARKASAPLVDRCRHFSVRSDEVWITTEGNPVEVEHVGEGVTKPITTGSVGQKISVVHKAAGVSEVSDELLHDGNGAVETLLSRQFSAATYQLVDKTLVAGTGSGEPTGLLNTNGVVQTPTGGQDGVSLFESIATEYAAIIADFYQPTTIALRPELLIRFLLVKDATGRPLYPSGLAPLFPQAEIVVDANLPNTLGAGGDETVIVLGDFSQFYFFERQPLTIESSPYPLWESDQTSFRAVLRYGAACVVPQAFRVVSGIVLS